MTGATNSSCNGVAAEKRGAQANEQQAKRYLTFTLCGEEYGICIMAAHEIIGMHEITPVPMLPEFVRGVINLRGHIISVIDMRLRFGMAFAEYDEMTCILIVKARNITLGLVVDRVSEVVDLRESQIDETPAFGEAVETQYISGIGKYSGRVIILLDTDRILSEEETAGLEKA